ncbi:hypothetical protein ILYODFUR_020415 [Ilyodon furcidens]|uniref:Uncharacterized protein n=1 Tax=Ilyodon furcidens TaxID=33524 RepID=A0ABV0U8S7_9TELE
MRLPSSYLHFGIAPPHIMTVEPGQKKDPAAGEGMITLWESLRHAPEKRARQAEEVEEQRSAFLGSKLPISFPGTGPTSLHLPRVSVVPCLCHSPVVRLCVSCFLLLML